MEGDVIDQGWKRAIHVLGPDLPPAEWARRIGCTVDEVAREMRRADVVRVVRGAQSRRLAELESSNQALRALLAETWEAA